MATFSERYGYKPASAALQIDSIDRALRVGLWNGVDLAYWSTIESSVRLGPRYLLSTNPKHDHLFRSLWSNHFKSKLSSLPDDASMAIKIVEQRYEKMAWNEVYDFIEFLSAAYPGEENNASFMKYCNVILGREASGYRFVGGQITRIIDHTEIDAIDEALKAPHDPIRAHLVAALEKFSDRQKPDYRNSVKESISAVEAAAQFVTGKPKATLEDALKAMKNHQGLHPALNESFRKLYAYTSDSDGIRHAITEESRDVALEEAKFMLVACSAFVNLLLESTSRVHAATIPPGEGSSTSKGGA